MKSYANVQNYFVNYQHLLLLYNVKDTRPLSEKGLLMIFYFSGTGNSLHAAKALAGEGEALERLCA